jgi:Xaa-Pro aminopeptidase
VTDSRISRIQELLQDGQLFYVTNLINIRYLCGFTGSNGALLITKESATLATDSRYEIQSAQQCFDVDFAIGRNLSELLIKNEKSTEIWFESNHLSVSQLTALNETFPIHKFVAKTGIVEAHRQVKDEAELRTIRTACEISVAAWRMSIEQIKIGQSEREIRNNLEHNMRNLGADDVAFSSIVAAGPNSAIPHHEPTDRKVTSGDFLKIDFGAKIDGYHADCTRTVVVGKAADWQTEIYQALAFAQAAGRGALSSHASYLAVESAVSDTLKASGHLEFFTHGLGHGVGLEIHETPFFGRGSQDKIAENTVLTIEPGIYLRDRGGVRIEDTVVVKGESYENLTDLPYELIEI